MGYLFNQAFSSDDFVCPRIISMGDDGETNIFNLLLERVTNSVIDLIFIINFRFILKKTSGFTRELTCERVSSIR